MDTTKIMSQCSYCSSNLQDNNYKTIVRFNQPNSILNNFRHLKVCDNCIVTMKKRGELSTDKAKDHGADFNLVIDQTSQYQF